MIITTSEQLRELYAVPKERTLLKELTKLDVHCKNFIERSPFFVLATVNGIGEIDASPRGGSPGFVRVLDDHTLLLPDAPGNNRLDSLNNVVETGRVGLLFMIPGMDETLRINGGGSVSVERTLLEHFSKERKPPKTILKVEVRQAFIHCAKAFMRSALWSAESQIERDEFPTIGKMINDQIGSDEVPETREEMIARYKDDL